MQIGVEVVSLVILIRATLGREIQMVKVSRTVVGVAFAVAFVAVIGLFGIQVFTEFPGFGTPVMERFSDAPSATYLAQGLQETGAPNIVTAVLLDFRAWDTLGEATVLFCAALGAVAILRRKARPAPTAVISNGGRTGMNALDKPRPGMSMIVRTVTRWLKGPILLFGIYIVLYGHITPGGGFGGGVIIACAFILVMLALGGRVGWAFSARARPRGSTALAC